MCMTECCGERNYGKCLVMMLIIYRRMSTSKCGLAVKYYDKVKENKDQPLAYVDELKMAPQICVSECFDRKVCLLFQG